MALNYNAPIDGQKSNIDGADSDQMQSFLWLRKSIIEARKEQYFFPLASVKNMPKHHGKTIKVYEYLPLLDDRNVNDQGIDASGATIVNGNLYGSSKDVGTIRDGLPTLTENGGRVNRVGFKRVSLEGGIQEFGFFTEFTRDSIEFDSDDQLREHLAREMMNGAVQMQEAQIQIDLLEGAGVELFTGTATDDDEITAEGATPSIVTHDDLMRLDQILTKNRTPRHTQIITGSRFTDTRVVPACRVMYVGAEVSPILRKMKDSLGDRAFIEIQHYADAATQMNGEIGSVGPFRIIEVPEMLHWAGEGAAVTNNPGYRATDSKYDVFPMLVVGDDSFTALGFQNDGKKLGVNVMTRQYGKEAMDHNDPYGKKGITSMTWFYGMLVYRPERIGIIKTVAPL